MASTYNGDDGYQSQTHAKWDDAEVATMIEILMGASDANTSDDGLKTSTWQQVTHALADDFKTRHTCVQDLLGLRGIIKRLNTYTI